MPTTARQLIRRALLLIEAISAEAPMSATEGQDGLATLNDMLASWSLERLFIYHTPETVLTLVPGQSPYTWGPLGDIDGLRPFKLEMAELTLTDTGPPPLDLPLAIWDDRQYQQGIALKTFQSSYPQGVYLEMSFPLARLHVWPVPERAYPVKLFPWQPFSRFASIDAQVNFPEGYERALRYGLAVDLSPEYGKTPSPMVGAVLAESKANIKRVNKRAPVLACDLATLVNNSNSEIRSDIPGFMSDYPTPGRYS